MNLLIATNLWLFRKQWLVILFFGSLFCSTWVFALNLWSCVSGVVNCVFAGGVEANEGRDLCFAGPHLVRASVVVGHLV